MPSNEPQTNRERTGKQDLAQAVGAGGWYGLGWAAPGTPPAPGVAGPGGFVGGSGFAGYPGYGYQPVAALVGAGTFEGTNKYATPLVGGGVAAYGLLPGVRPWAGTYGTYRIMSAHPTIFLAAIALMAPILSADWTVEEVKPRRPRPGRGVTRRKAAPSDAKEAAEELLLPMRQRLVWECLRGLVFGHKSFEKVWELRDGFITYRKVKPLLPELTTILVGPNGDYAGVTESIADTSSSADGGDRRTGIPPLYAWTYTYDLDGSNYYGRPLMENCRRAWSNWLNVEDNLAALGRKVASIIPVVKYPAGEGIDANGAKVSNHQTAVTIAGGLASGRPVVVENLSQAQVDDLRHVAELAKASLWTIDTVDMGNPGPTLEALLEQLTILDKHLVRGWAQPERSLLEARHGGSRADSDQAGDVGLSVCDLISADVADSACRGLLDDWTEANYGPAARGTLRLRASPIVDELRGMAREIVTALASNPITLPDLRKRIDLDPLLSHLKVPRSEFSGPWEG
jgi:hypothetical protein